MTKTDKKREKQLREMLTNLCEQHCKNMPGFCWLTHHIDWKSPQTSFALTLVFADGIDRDAFIGSSEQAQLEREVHDILKAMGVALKHTAKHIKYDYNS